MPLQALGRGIGNAFVPECKNTRYFSGAVIASGVALAVIGILGFTYPGLIFKAGTSAATIMRISINLTAVGGGLMVAPSIVNAGAKAVKAVKEYGEKYDFYEDVPVLVASISSSTQLTDAEGLSKDDPGYRSEY